MPWSSSIGMAATKTLSVAICGSMTGLLARRSTRTSAASAKHPIDRLSTIGRELHPSMTA
eukprot:7386840-Prymnesium_polylepis.3